MSAFFVYFFNTLFHLQVYYNFKTTDIRVLIKEEDIQVSLTENQDTCHTPNNLYVKMSMIYIFFRYFILRLEYMTPHL